MLATATALVLLALSHPQEGQPSGFSQHGSGNQRGGFSQNGGGATGGGFSQNGGATGGGFSQGGEMSAAASQAAAAAPSWHFHMSGTTAAQAVGSGGGPPADPSKPAPGYVQAKYVMPTGVSFAAHHYATGMPPPLGMGGPNDGNAANANYIANGTVAGNPGLVNWGLTPAWDREELGNGAWLGQQGSANPMPYIGGFND